MSHLHLCNRYMKKCRIDELSLQIKAAYTLFVARCNAYHRLVVSCFGRKKVVFIVFNGELIPARKRMLFFKFIPSALSTK